MKKLILVIIGICILGSGCRSGAVSQERYGGNQKPQEQPGETSTVAVTESGQPVLSADLEKKTKIGVADILIPESSCLAETPFMVSDMEHILEEDSELERVDGSEGANGRYIYWKGAGIEYVTYSTGNDLLGVVLHHDSYSLANGIQTGMAESELLRIGYPFDKYESAEDSGSGAVIFGSGLLRDEAGPLNTADYDSIYVYAGTVSAEEAQAYGISEGACYSIVLLIKDGVVNKVILDMPAAG